MPMLASYVTDQASRLYARTIEFVIVARTARFAASMSALGLDASFARAVVSPKGLRKIATSYLNS
jgi:hypothetical protein